MSLFLKLGPGSCVMGYSRSLFILSNAFIIAVQSVSPNIEPIALPSAPPISSAEKLDPSLASLSIEFSYLPSFGGNLSNPNLLTKALMEQIVERTGVGPDVRPGGITMYASSIFLHRVVLTSRYSDSSVFSPTAPALLLDESLVRTFI